MKISHKTSKTLCNKLLNLERTGRLDDAFYLVEEIWSDRTKLPDVEHFEPYTAAELILRCGSLIGFIGHNKQLPNSQEKSKNLLTEARGRFLEIYDIEKIAECENYLALAYWRAGELNEAEDWLNEAFSHKISHTNLVILHSIIIQSMIFLSAKNYQKVLDNLEDLETIFLKHADNFLIGSFYNNLGIAYECLDKIPFALKLLEKGKMFYLKSGNKFQYAVAENNLSMLYKTQKDYAKAHQTSSNAANIFKKIKDRTREGFSLDTKAQIYVAEQNYDKALETIEKAIKIIKKSENISFITETYLTKTKILIEVDDISGATGCLFEAVELAKINTGEEAAERLIKEYESALRKKFENPINSKLKKPLLEIELNNTEIISEKNKDGEFKIILSASIAHYNNIQTIQISNKHLEYAGLEQGSFAIVACIEIEKGDLAAIMDLETHAVVCGFYDQAFGIVCLENQLSEPMLFDIDSIEILGKIIGVGKPDSSNEKNIYVTSLIN